MKLQKTSMKNKIKKLYFNKLQNLLLRKREQKLMALKMWQINLKLYHHQKRMRNQMKMILTIQRKMMYKLKKMIRRTMMIYLLQNSNQILNPLLLLLINNSGWFQTLFKNSMARHLMISMIKLLKTEHLLVSLEHLSVTHVDPILNLKNKLLTKPGWSSAC